MRHVPRFLQFIALAALATLGARRARAQSDDAADRSNPAEAAAEAGMLLPTTLSPRTDSQRAYFLALGGYDTSRDSAQSDVFADVSILSWLALRAGLQYTQYPDRFRPTFGARVQILGQDKAGLDLGAGAFLKPEGFSEAEAEVELVVALARRFGRFTTFANLVYGQDPEASERDGEVRLAALYSATKSIQVGLDSRLRVDLGSEEGERHAEGGAEYDLVFGPTASFAVGPIAAVAQAGMSVYGTEPAQPGGVVQIGIAGAL